MANDRNKVGSIYWEADLDNKKLKKGVAESQTGIKGLTKSISNSISTVKGFAVTLGIVFGARTIFNFIKSSITAFNDYERILAQTESVIKSTGGAAGMTAQQVQELASQIQRLTPISDETAKAGMNMLMTFTNIGKTVFPDTTRALMDMATAMNGGVIPSQEQVTSTAIQLGKALNNPIDGITALTRVGVKFTYEQKQLIEQLVRTGKTAEAQKIILKELNSEFGGSAASQMNTYAGKIASISNSFTDLKEIVGHAFVNSFSYLIDAFVQTEGAGSALIVMARILASTFVIVGSTIKTIGLQIGKVFSSITGFISDGLKGAKANVEAVNYLIEDNAEKTDEALKNIWKSQEEVQADIRQKETAANQAYYDEKTAQAEKQAAEENEAYKDASEKRLKNFQESLADMLWSHQDKVDDVKKSIEEENDAFAESDAEREKSFQKSLSKMIKDHEKKVLKIKEQIEDEKDATKKANDEILEDAADEKEDETKEHDKKIAELEKQIDHEVLLGKNGSKSKIALLKEQIAEENEAYEEKLKDIDKDAKKEITKNNEKLDEKLADLKSELAEENTSYAEQKAELEQENLDTTEKLKKEHEKRLADYQETLDEEMAILKKHEGDLSLIKDKVKEDDITRLKRKYEEENAEAEKQHKKKLADIKENAYSEGDTQIKSYGSGVSDNKGPVEDLGNQITDNLLADKDNKSRESGENVIMNFFKGMYEKIEGLPDIVKTVIGTLPGWSWINYLPHFAEGVTNFQGGPALVGELGPEIVDLPKGSNVYSNKDSKDIIGGRQQNIKIYIDKVRDYQDVQSIGRELGLRAGMQPS